MSSWGSDESFYDDVEKEHLAWLQEHLPSYLKFHEMHCGFLPENFNGGALPSSDPRAIELTRLGFLSYSILVNALLVMHAAETAPALTSMLDVYGRTSAFFLRAGAVIDIAIPLEASQSRLFGGGKMVDGPKGSPLAEALKTRLDVVDKYNNFLKHNGLPAVRLVETDGTKTVQIPAQMPMRAAIWSAQNPNTALGTMLGCYMLDVMAALNDYYAALLGRSANVLAAWGLSASGTAGIRTVLKQANSGSLERLDGYQSYASAAHFLKWG